MADKKCTITFNLSNNKKVTGSFTLPTGTKGDSGDGIQYIYYCPGSTSQLNWDNVTDNTNPSTWDAVQNDILSNAIVNSIWTTIPVNIDITHKYQYVSTRTKSSGVWSKFSTPAIFSMYTQSAAGTKGGHYEQRFKSTATQTTPSLPSSLTDTSWTKYADNTNDYIWMATVFVDGDGNTEGSWNGPWIISSKGDSGVDGDKYEYIYKANDGSSLVLTKPSDYDTNIIYQKEDYIPTGWTDSPSGVSDTIQYEWMALRYKTYNSTTKKYIWSWFTTPCVWSHWGVDGTDGDGVQYIFNTQIAKRIWNTTDSDNPNSWAAVQSTTESDSVPSTYWNKTWFDNPQELSSTILFQYVSIRKKINGIWGKYSQPVLWNRYALDGTNTTQALNAIITKLNNTYTAGTKYFDGTIKSTINSNGRFIYGDAKYDSTQSFYYKDVVKYTYTNSNNISYSVWITPTTNANGYITSADIPATINESTGIWTVTSDWTLLNYTEASYINTLIANSAYIKNLTASDIVITDTSGNPQAGITGSSATNNTSKITPSNIRFWAGLQYTESGTTKYYSDLTKAKFYVTDQGKLHSSDADITGTINATSLSATMSKANIYVSDATTVDISKLINNGSFTIKNNNGEAVAFFDYETSGSIGGCFLWIKNPSDGNWYRLDFSKLTTTGQTIVIVPSSWSTEEYIGSCSTTSLINVCGLRATPGSQATEKIYKYTSGTKNGVKIDATNDGKYFITDTISDSNLYTGNFLSCDTANNDVANDLSGFVDAINTTNIDTTSTGSVGSATPALTKVSYSTSSLKANYIILTRFISGVPRSYSFMGYYPSNRLFLYLRDDAIIEAKKYSYTVKIGPDTTTLYTIPALPDNPESITVAQLLTWLDALPTAIKNLI